MKTKGQRTFFTPDTRASEGDIWAICCGKEDDMKIADRLQPIWAMVLLLWLGTVGTAPADTLEDAFMAYQAKDYK